MYAIKMHVTLYVCVTKLYTTLYACVCVYEVNDTPIITSKKSVKLTTVSYYDAYT